MKRRVAWFLFLSAPQRPSLTYPQPLVFLVCRKPADAAAAAAAALGSIALQSTSLRGQLVREGRAVGMLCRSLSSKEHQVQMAACTALRILALDQEASHQMSDVGLQSLVYVLNCGDAQVKESAAAVTGSLALHESGRAALLKTQVVPALVKLIQVRDAEVQESAARALKNLGLAEGTSSQVSNAGGMPHLVRLLRSQSEAIHQAAAAALEVLTMDKPRRDELLATLPSLPTDCL